MFNKLTKASKVVVGVVGGIAKAGAIIAKNLKKIILTTNMGDLIRLLVSLIDKWRAVALLIFLSIYVSAFVATRSTWPLRHVRRLLA